MASKNVCDNSQKAPHSMCRIICCKILAYKFMVIAFIQWQYACAKVHTHKHAERSILGNRFFWPFCNTQNISRAVEISSNFNAFDFTDEESAEILTVLNFCVNFVSLKVSLLIFCCWFRWVSSDIYLLFFIFFPKSLFCCV